jgi:hypothetical protein
LLAILLPDDLTRELPGELIRLRRIFGDRAYCALTRRFLPDEAARLRMIATAAAQARVATIATNDVLYHCPSRRMLQDVVTCIRLHTTIDNAGFQKERHADRYLKPPEEMLRLFPKYKEAVHRTWEIAERCRFFRTDLMRSFRFTFFIVDQEMSSSFASSRNVLSGTGSPPTSMSRRSVRAPPPRKTTEPVAGGRLDAAFGVASIAEFNLLNSRTSAEISGAGRHRRLAQSCQRSLTRRLHRAAAATDARNSTMCFKVLSKKNDPPDPNKNLWRRARFQLAFMVGPWQAAQAASGQPYRPAGRRLRDNQRFRRRRFLSS